MYSSERVVVASNVSRWICGRITPFFLGPQSVRHTASDTTRSGLLGRTVGPQSTVSHSVLSRGRTHPTLCRSTVRTVPRLSFRAAHQSYGRSLRGANVCRQMLSLMGQQSPNLQQRDDRGAAHRAARAPSKPSSTGGRGPGRRGHRPRGSRLTCAGGCAPGACVRPATRGACGGRGRTDLWCSRRL